MRLVPKRNDDFFKAKKPWSETKDALLGCYLKPYFEKIKTLKTPICYIDGFAGKGKFDDGKDGSPRIALQVISESIEGFNTFQKPIVNFYFVDLNYEDELRKNIQDYSAFQCHVIGDKFEGVIDKILANSINMCVFIYIDPYGIKALDCAKFASFATSRNFRNVELLINFNSYGFLREACRIRNVVVNDEKVKKIVDALEEYDSSPVKSIDDMTRIIGSSGWINIIDDYAISGNTFETEIKLGDLFCENLRKGYKYVLNMPIRSRDEVGTKYRLIHCCNHQDGFKLMVNNMYKRSEELRDKRRHGQLSLLDFDVNDKAVTEEELKNNIFSCIDTEEKQLFDVYFEFFNKVGIPCGTSKLVNLLKEAEKNGIIAVRREPELTPKGKKSAFWEEKYGKDRQSVFVMKISK